MHPARSGIPRVDHLVAVQRTFGYNAEDARLIVQPMAGESKEPTWSMGDLFVTEGAPDEAWEIVPEVFNLEDQLARP